MYEKKNMSGSTLMSISDEARDGFRNFDMARTISFFIAGMLILESRLCRSLGDPTNETSWETALIYDAALFPFFHNLTDIFEHLPYLEYLNVDAILIGPLFEWPYRNELSIYYSGTHRRFGTMEHFRRLLDGAHASGIKCILVVMPYYTSDQHPWFQGWRNNEPPYNNFYAAFEKRNLELDVTTDLKKLNLSNHEVRRRLKEELFEFWLDKGVDGFFIERKTEYMPDDKRTKSEKEMLIKADKDYLRDIRKVVGDWAIQHKSESKYLAVVTDELENDWSSYYGTKTSPGILPINFNNAWPLDVIFSGHASRLKNFLKKKFTAVPFNTNATLIFCDHKLWESASTIKTKRMSTFNVLSMVLPGQAYLVSNSRPSDVMSDLWTTYNLTSALALMRKYPAFRDGDFQTGALNSDTILVLRRSISNDPPVYVVVCNFADTEQTVNLLEIFSDLEEQLTIVLTSSRNESLRALKVASRDSVTVSPGAGTVLRSGREKRETEDGEVRRGDVSDETTETEEADGGGGGGSTTEDGPTKKGTNVTTIHGREREEKKTVWAIWEPIKQFWQLAASTYKKKIWNPWLSFLKAYGQARQ